MAQQVKELEKSSALAMETVVYFDTERDNALIAKGTHFFCNACSIAVLIEEQSQDPRYCQECYAFLRKETKILSASRNPGWIPKPQKASRRPTLHPLPDTSASMDIIKEKVNEVSNDLPAIMSTPKDKRGPKFTELPDDLIRQLAGKGFSSQAIANKLADEHQIFVSYKTIKRRLQGVLV